MSSITNANLDWNEAGTPVSDQFDDVYFSNVNGLEETRYVFLHQNGLPERWHSTTKRRFVIGETGFGTGLNFLAVWQRFAEFRQQYPECETKELHFITFEKYPIQLHDLIKAHESWPELKKYAAELHKYYPPAVAGCHRIVLADGMITLDLWFGDIKDCMPQVPFADDGIIDCWFLDGFAPSKNPEMWNQTLFNNMAKLSREQCSCATFTAAGFVRRGLIEAGFDMKKVKGFGTKRDMLAGSLQQRTSMSNMAPWFRLYETNNVTDIAIIGGGIASASLAKALCRRGLSVALFCKDAKPAEGASGNRQGAIYPLLTKENNEISRIFSNAFFYTRQFINQAAEQCDFAHQWCGVTQLMWDDKSSKKLNNILDGDYHRDLVYRQTGEETNETLGLKTEMESLFYPLGGWLCPAQFTEQTLRQLEEQSNLTTHYSCEITDIAHEGSHWVLSTNDGLQFQHQSVVVANGHQFGQLSFANQLPLGQVKGQVSYIPTNPELSKMQSVLCYDGYMTPCDEQHQSHCIGASYDKQHIDTIFDAAAQEENKQRLINCLPNQSWPEEVDISDNQSRQGVRCVSRDHLPFVGNIAQLDSVKQQYKNLVKEDLESAQTLSCEPNLYAFLGLGSRGLSTAPFLGEYLASLIAGDPLPLAVDLTERLHPARMWVRKLRKGKPVES
ncbi:bifunctional tRNA (5-methylaminomethyl-2-thiouridine)(34)-methyltransferase MnmD/FAD-dependent 5-carboxymethylaminomethyl-2-thiouridine(34) oxidoreductase MnmC [Vibrio sp.]|nr:bifunctional tRNA (5-methylaminomethyl-2-thiouridine)(34)-methyltransferase MnmD/FAD-dependent 5-carboxymethylaminomethyl-2-thiouridine(34) oxidoreductase MnmC [Vibrio sp.]